MLIACQLAIYSLQECDVKTCDFGMKNLSESQYLQECQTQSSFAVIGFYKIFKAQILALLRFV
jgi:hypothetical protein